MCQQTACTFFFGFPAKYEYSVLGTKNVDSGDTCEHWRVNNNKKSTYIITTHYLFIYLFI